MVLRPTGQHRSWPALLAHQICPECFELRRTHAGDGSAALGGPLDPQETAQVFDLTPKCLLGTVLGPLGTLLSLAMIPAILYFLT